MFYRLLADIIVLLHFAFILYAMFGGFLLLLSKRLIWLHVPTVVWAAGIEFGGWICPLTPLENTLRSMGGGTPYRSGFVEHYILPLLYPAALTRSLQIAIGCLVVGMNLAIYWWIFSRSTSKKTFS